MTGTRKSLAEVRRALALVEAGQAAEALAIYRRLLVEARKGGFETSYLHFASAHACLALNDLETAFEELTLAIARDPVCPGYRGSFEDLLRRIREALADPGRARDEPSTAGLYALLVRAGCADVASHVVMGRHLLATGEWGAARRLADALTQLHPTSPEAWELASEVAASVDPRAAEQARQQAAASATALLARAAGSA